MARITELDEVARGAPRTGKRGGVIAGGLGKLSTSPAVTIVNGRTCAKPEKPATAPPPPSLPAREDAGTDPIRNRTFPAAPTPLFASSPGFVAAAGLP